MKKILLSLLAVLFTTLGLQAQTFEWGTATWNITDGQTFDGIENFEQAGLTLSYPNPSGFRLTFLNVIVVDYNVYVDGSDTPIEASSSAQMSSDVKIDYGFVEGHSYRIETTKALLAQANIATRSTDTLTTNTDKYTISFTINGPQVVDTIKTEGTMALTIVDQNAQPTFTVLDTTAIKSALGINDLTEATVYGLNPDGSYNKDFESQYDGWRDADGNFTYYTAVNNWVNGVHYYSAVYDIKLSPTRDSVYYYFYDDWKVYDPTAPDSVSGSGMGGLTRAPQTSYNHVIWDWQDGDSIIQYRRSYRVDEGVDYPASFLYIANNKAVRIDATLHFVSQEAYAAYLDSIGTQYTGVIKAGIAMRADPGTPLDNNTTDQTVTIRKGSEDGLVNITFSGFNFPMMNMPTGELTLTDVKAETDANGNTVYSLEDQAVAIKRGMMSINYQASLTGTQAEGSTPVLTLTLSQATVVTAVFGADEATASEAFDAAYDAVLGVESVKTQATGADSYYDLSGKALAAPVKGVNIVKKADGTVVKVVIK